MAAFAINYAWLIVPVKSEFPHLSSDFAARAAKWEGVRPGRKSWFSAGLILPILLSQLHPSLGRQVKAVVDPKVAPGKNLGWLEGPKPKFGRATLGIVDSTSYGAMGPV